MSPTADAHGQTFGNSTAANTSCTFIRTRREKTKACKEQSTQRYQNKNKSSRSLVCWTHWYFIFAKFNTCTPLHIKLDKYLAARPFKLWYQNWHFPYCSSNEFNILKLKSNICHGIYIYIIFFLTCMIHDTWSDTCNFSSPCMYQIMYHVSCM